MFCYLDYYCKLFLFCFAGTYVEAVKKLKILETEDNAFTGSDVDLESETNKIQQAVKKQRLQKEMAALEAKHDSAIKAQAASLTPESSLNLTLDGQKQVVDQSKEKLSTQTSSVSCAIPQSTFKKSADADEVKKSSDDQPPNSKQAIAQGIQDNRSSPPGTF